MEQSAFDFRYISPRRLTEDHDCDSRQTAVAAHFGYSSKDIQCQTMNKQILFCLILVALVAATVAAQKTNTTARPAASEKVTAKSARSEYHHGFEHHFPHYHGGHHLGGFGHHKEFDQYLIPLLVVLGLGVLVMPLLSVFMTTLVGNVPVTTLVSGRKKREVPGTFNTEEKITELFKRFGRALDAFNAEDK